ncbi:trans-splicing intein-formed DNA polymerase III subunit alpha C-terminal partner DnaE-C, partial [Streptomyces caeruleatus]
IIAERNAHGSFKNLFDFCQRVDLRKVNRRVLEALIKAGAMDKLGPTRSALFASIDKALHMAEQALRNQEQGQSDLFGV